MHISNLGDLENFLFVYGTSDLLTESALYILFYID